MPKCMAQALSSFGLLAIQSGADALSSALPGNPKAPVILGIVRISLACPLPHKLTAQNICAETILLF